MRQLVDDSEIPDGAGERVASSLRGTEYQIDLPNSNLAKFEKALKPYVETGAKLRGRGVPAPKLLARLLYRAGSSSQLSGTGRIATAMMCLIEDGSRLRSSKHLRRRTEFLSRASLKPIQYRTSLQRSLRRLRAARWEHRAPAGHYDHVLCRSRDYGALLVTGR